MELAKIFGSKVRVKLLCILVFNWDEEFHQSKLGRLTEFNLSAVQKELAQLEESGLVKKRRSGNRLYYRIETGHFLYEDLKSILVKTEGLAGVIKAAIEDADGIDFAFIYGSFAKRHADSISDIDLMVIGDISFSDVVQLIREPQKELSREINPSVYSLEEFRKNLKEGKHFIISVYNDAKIFVIGDQDELRRLVE